MKIAIISDSHDNLVNIDKMLSWCAKEKIETILDCGDWCAPSVISFVGDKYAGALYWVSGNVHGELDQMQEISAKYNFKYLSDGSIIEISGLKIGLTHYPNIAKKLAQENHLDFVFYGHTHQPWEETIMGARVVNPGTLAGMFYKATFAVLDTATKKLDLKILELM